MRSGDITGVAGGTGIDLVLHRNTCSVLGTQFFFYQITLLELD